MRIKVRILDMEKISQKETTVDVVIIQLNKNQLGFEATVSGEG